MSSVTETILSKTQKKPKSFKRHHLCCSQNRWINEGKEYIWTYCLVIIYKLFYCFKRIFPHVNVRAFSKSLPFFTHLKENILYLALLSKERYSLGSSALALVVLTPLSMNKPAWNKEKRKEKSYYPKLKIE